MSEKNNVVQITQAEMEELLALKAKAEKAKEYRKAYNQREDVKEKQRAYHKTRNKLITQLLKEARSK